MENKPIFLSMAAIDGKKAEQNQWLPKELFPLRTHRIAAPRRTYNSDKFSFCEGKGDASKCRGFPFEVVIGVMDILKF